MHQILREKGWTQKDLAEKLEKTPSEVSKWLNGDHNFTLKSIAKLEAELNAEIIYVSRKDSFHVQRGGNIKAAAVRAEHVPTKVQFVDAKKAPTKINESPLAA